MAIKWQWASSDQTGARAHVVGVDPSGKRVARGRPVVRTQLFDLCAASAAQSAAGPARAQTDQRRPKSPTRGNGALE